MSALAARPEQLSPRVVEFTWCDGDDPIRWADAISLWRKSQTFRALVTRTLADLPFDALFWETPPVTRTTTSRPFTFIAADAPVLTSMPIDRSSFPSHLVDGHGTDAICTFANLGGDATLLAPCQNSDPEHYGHLAAFLRGAPATQVDALWREVGDAIESNLSDAPLWVSTSGAGVAWLHVRLDSSPKYYTHAPYRSAP